jgi:hypothetical protein
MSTSCICHKALRPKHIERFRAFFLAAVLLPSAASGICPFNADQQGSAVGAATTDGLLFIRYALNLSDAALAANAVQNNATAASVATYIQSNAASLDIDGDGKFTTSDATVVARYLLGYRGASLASGLPALEFAKRYGGVALQDYIDNGCTGVDDLPDPRVVVWNSMNAALVAGNVAQAKTFLTENGLSNHGPALDALLSQMPAITASYSPLVAKLVVDGYAEYIVSRAVPGSATNEKAVFFVTFLQLPDGTWLIDAM